MKYEIYQLKEDTMEQVKLRFMASDQAAQLGGIHRENYRRVYGGEIPSVPEAGRMLLRLFALFNGSNRPVDFSGHSMSVSDIVRLTEDPHGAARAPPPAGGHRARPRKMFSA